MELHHHVDEREEPKGAGFEAAELDEYGVGTAVNYADRGEDPYYAAIRGREQQMIDYNGGAWSDTGKPYKTENKIRGVRKANEKGLKYHKAASFLFGELCPYTGN